MLWVNFDIGIGGADGTLGLLSILSETILCDVVDGMIGGGGGGAKEPPVTDRKAVPLVLDFGSDTFGNGI